MDSSGWTIVMERERDRGRQSKRERGERKRAMKGVKLCYQSQVSKMITT